LNPALQASAFTRFCLRHAAAEFARFTMLNSFFRPVTLPVRVQLPRWAIPLIVTAMLVVPLAHAAETMAMETQAEPKEMGVAPASPLDQYQKWRDEPVSDWIQSNDRVGEIGGWLTYLRDAQPGDGAAESSSHSQHQH